MEQRCWTQSLHTVGEAASPGTAGRTARGTCKTSRLGKQAGAWLPAPLLAATFAYGLPSVGWEPCTSQSHSAHRASRRSSSGLTRASAELRHSPISQPGLALELAGLAAPAPMGGRVMKSCSKEAKGSALVGFFRFSFLRPRRRKAVCFV